MISLLSLIILNSLVCLGFYKAIQFEYKYIQPVPVSKGARGKIDEDSKNILWWYKRYFLDNLPVRVAKPLGGCLVCMASVFSFVPYWAYDRCDFTNPQAWFIYILYIFALAGANSILYRLTEE